MEDQCISSLWREWTVAVVVEALRFARYINRVS